MNPFLQFFELAALSWLLMEGIYYYSTLKPLFNDNNTVPIVFYFAVGWGESHLLETVIYVMSFCSTTKLKPFLHHQLTPTAY